MNWIKKVFDWKNLLLLAISLTIALILVEIMLRFIWCNGKNEQFDYQSAPYITSNKYWRVWHYPNVEVIHKRVCFEAKYKTNSVGMKYHEVSEEKPKIALLGDSFIEGWGVSNEDTIAYKMEEMLNKKYDVLPLGTSGGFGTVDEVALYENLGKYYKPKVVILFFLNYNDLYDNLKSWREFHQVSQDLTKLTYPIAKGFDEVLKEIQSKKPSGMKKLTQYNICLPRFIEYSKIVLDAKFKMLINSRLTFSNKFVNVYNPNETEDIKNSWKITKLALERLKRVVEENGAKLIVMQIADPYQIDENWIRLVEMKKGVKLDPLYPNKKLRQICKELGIEYVSMYDYFQKYKKEHNLKYPYFSLECDKHYSPFGHKLMAEFVVKYLKNKNYVEVGK